MVVGRFQPKVIPNVQALQVSTGHGKGHFIFAGLQQGGVEAHDALRPQALVGIVADGVGVPQRGVLWTVSADLDGIWAKELFGRRVAAETANATRI